MNKYKLEITLKQYTPLIHFQHDQEGATLRASEVKPKLDKFIKTGLENLYPEIYKKYTELIDSPYKLSIRMKDEKAIDKYIIGSFIPKKRIADYRKKGFEILDKTPYFADNKSIRDGLPDNKPIRDGLPDNDNYKLGIMLKEKNSIDLIFRFLDSKWYDFLKEIVPVFFTVTNFGTRQNKGFGCFLPDIDQDKLEKYLGHFSNGALYRSSKTFDLPYAFIEIDKIYKILKSGGQKTKSELRKYFNDNSIEWEKPAIQEKIQDITQKLRISRKTENYQFVRALLGLPELYEYPKNRMKVQVKCEDIKRYASPLSFKFFNGYIYLYVSQRESEITGKEFGFEFDNAGRDYGKRLDLTTPKEFDVVDFLNESMKYQYSWEKIRLQL